MPIYLCLVSLATFATTTELSTCDIEHMDCKTKNIDYLSGSFRRSADPD